jgi:GntR family transcriptional regulator
MYQQVIDGVKSAIAKGWLPPGEKLPAVRELAMELTINHNTVVKAYAELEREHVIEMVRGRGTFVTRQPIVPNAEIRIRRLRESVLRIAIEAYHLQIQDDELIDMLKQSLAELHGENRLGGDES